MKEIIKRMKSSNKISDSNHGNLNTWTIILEKRLLDH